ARPPSGGLELEHHDADRNSPGKCAAETRGIDHHAGSQRRTEGHAAELEQISAAAAESLLQVRVDDPERGAVTGHGAGAEIRMREEYRDADGRISVLHEPDDAFWRDDGAVDLDPGLGARGEGQRRDDVFADGVMHCFG